VAESIIVGKGCHGEEFMLAGLTRQRDMLKIEGFFNTFRERVVANDFFRSCETAIDWIEAL
jgi:hypothetical protein